MTVLRTIRVARHAAAVCACVVLAACSGPTEPLVVGMSDSALDLVLGAEARVITLAPPSAPLPPQVTFEQPVSLPLPVVQPSSSPSPSPEPSPLPPPPPAPLPCPELPHRPILKAAVTNTALLPPAPATYEYRSSGGIFDVSHPDSPIVSYPGTMTREVTDVVAEKASLAPPGTAPDDISTFAVVTTFQDAVSGQELSTTTRWRLVPSSPGPTGADPLTGAGTQPVLAGLYLTGVESDQADGMRLPYPGIPVVRFPVTIGESFEATSSDGLYTMSFTSTVTDRVLVNACGEAVGAYVIELTDGVLASLEAGATAAFTTTFVIAPQYGGLVVAEQADVRSDVEQPGAEGQPAYTRTLDATINVVPEPPRAGVGRDEVDPSDHVDPTAVCEAPNPTAGLPFGVAYESALGCEE